MIEKSRWMKQLEHEWNENPLQVIAVTAMASSALAKIVNAWSAAKGRKAYAKQVNYRVRNR